jgi:TolA-binding protein
MNTLGRYGFPAIVVLFMLAGCSLRRETIRYRDEYFRPVAVIPQRNYTALSSADLEKLSQQLESATKNVIILRDSLTSLQKLSGSLLSSTRVLVDKVTELETKEFLTTSKQKDFENSITALQTENKQLSHQLAELHARLQAGTANPKPTVFSPARTVSSLQNEYNEGISLFRQRQYQDALITFGGLIEKGIEEDLVDNCEYWMGECRFAKHEYHEAIYAFQKVLAIEVSNKKGDAYFMLGRSYEQIDDFMKARWAYEELNVHYPNNEHTNFVKYRLDALRSKILTPNSSKHKKANV